MSPSSAGYRVLAQDIRAAGLLERRRLYYGAKIGLTIAALAGAWVALVTIGNSWAVLGVAAFMGVMFTQLGFIGHDAGHQQVFSTRRGNRLLGLLVGNALIGLSYGWWVPKHSAHHGHPNEVGRDPDIGLGLFPVCGDDDPGRSAVARFLTRWSAALFFPLMVLRSLGLQVSGVQQLLGRRDRAAVNEALLLALHAGAFFTAIFWVLGPVKALAFVAVQQSVFSVYLGCSFAPNHKAMPLIPPDAQLGFAHRQVVTARNVSGGALCTLMLGGLNYQIEHHLFPAMPRPNLRRAQGLVKAFCLASDLGYCETSLVDSYRRILRHLHAGAASTAALAPGAAA